MVIEKVVEKSDFDSNQLKNLIKDLTKENPEERITIQQALECLKGMGNDTDQQEILLNKYISEVRNRIKQNPSSISLNEDILKTNDLYIDLKITPSDPEKYKDQETEDLFQKINEEENLEEENEEENEEEEKGEEEALY